MRKKLVVLLMALLSSVGIAMFANVAPAAATPSGCSVSYLVDSNGTTYGVRVKCTSGTGHYRVYATCTDELRGSSGTYYGSWVGIGSYSTVVCPYEGGTYWVESNAHVQYEA